jgi:hypothetical protein
MLLPLGRKTEKYRLERGEVSQAVAIPTAAAQISGAADAERRKCRVSKTRVESEGSCSRNGRMGVA